MKSRAATSIGTIGFMAGAVIFAALAGVFLSRMLGSTYSRDPVRAVVVAKRAIAAGESLQGEDLRMALWPVGSVPEGAFASIEEVLKASRVPLIPMVRGEAVLQSHLSRPNAGIGIAPLIDRSHRAMSIRADDPVTLARLIYPGAHVDIISTIRAVGPRGQPITTSQTVIQNAKVLAVGEDIDPLSSTRREKNNKKASGGLSGPAADNDGREARGVVTLLVTLEQAEALSLASREGKLDVVLRSPRDVDTVSTSGVTAARLFGPPKAEMTVDESEGLQVSHADSPTSRRHRPGPRQRSSTAKAAAGGVDQSSGAGVIIFRGKVH